MRQLLNNPWVVLGLCAVATVILYFSADDIAVQPTAKSRPLPIRSLLSPESASPTLASAEVSLAQLTWPETFARDPFTPSTKPNGGAWSSGSQSGQETSTSRSSIDTENMEVPLPPQLQLSAVTLSPEPKVAMINRTLVTEGDRIEGLRVSRIESDGVWLNGPSGLHHLVFGVNQGKSQTVTRRKKVSTRLPENVQEDGRSRRETSVLDGRDCSRNSTCS